MKLLSPRSLTLGAFSFGYLPIALALKQCDRHVELMILQDASTSYLPMSKSMAKNMGLLIERIQDKIGSVAASVALFSDKPTPFRGNGLGRGHKEPIDLCYYNKATYPLGIDHEQLQEGYEAIELQNCEGGDFPENPYEAMIYAAQDPKVGWSQEIQNAENKTIIKIMVTVTDDHPHYAGDAKSGIKSWNPIEPPTTATSNTSTGTTGATGASGAGGASGASGAPEPPIPASDGYPRFFEKDFIELNAIYGGENGENREKYLRLVKLKEIGELNLTLEEKDEFKDLLDILGPAKFPLPTDHPGSFEIYENCQDYEYPKLELVGEILNREKILPIILLSKQSLNSNGIKLCKKRGVEKISSEDDWLKCLISIYKADLTQAGVNSFMVEPYGDDSENLMIQIVDLVDQMSYDLTCQDKPIAPGFIPARPSGGNTSGGTVAGAAGGAVAGAAAIGGLLYKKFGASLLGHNTPDLTTVEQVDVPDTPIEREAFEEVTMDMFQ